MSLIDLLTISPTGPYYYLATYGFIALYLLLTTVTGVRVYQWINYCEKIGLDKDTELNGFLTPFKMIGDAKKHAWNAHSALIMYTITIGLLIGTPWSVLY